MIVLDTNVLSECLKSQPEPQVLAWLSAQPKSTVFTSAVTMSEMMYGVHAMPCGTRQQQLLLAMESIFKEDFAGRVLSYDTNAALRFAPLAARRKQMGQPMSQFDAMIAAICLSHQATLATRNSKDFVGCGIELINPWGIN